MKYEMGALLWYMEVPGRRRIAWGIAGARLIGKEHHDPNN